MKWERETDRREKQKRKKLTKEYGENPKKQASKHSRRKKSEKQGKNNVPE